MSKAIVKLSFTFMLLGVFTGVLWFYRGYGSAQVAPTRLVVAKQPDCPLLILSTGIDSSEPQEPRYWYSITNTTEKQISAYAVQESVSLGPGPPIVSTTFVHFPAETLLFGSHQSRQEDGGIGKAYKTTPVKLVLTVDFVEFADGTRWGDDVGKSGERLDGKREGGKAAIKKYREILNNEGVAALEKALAKTTFIQPESSNESADWRDGFKTGVNIVTRRLVAAKIKDAQNGIKRELDKAFDSKAGRREP